MTYYVKGLIQEEYQRRLSEVSDFVVLQTIGLNGIDNNRLRGALLEKGIHLMVVKNSLMRRALESLGRQAGSQLFQAGPCTLAYGGETGSSEVPWCLCGRKNFGSGGSFRFGQNA